MRPAFTSLLACAAVFAAAHCFAGLDARAAQPVVRVKARLIAFDGRVMTLQPLPPSPGEQTADGAARRAEAFTVSVLPDTRYVSSNQTPFGAIKPGDYAGAAVTEGRGGNLQALDVYLYAEALRGTGEGRFPESGRLIINGTARAVQPATPKDRQGATLTLHYRGAVLTGAGRGRTTCEGRASPPAYASALACDADATIEVPPGTPVLALTMGDKSLLVPGLLVTVAMIKTADDKNVTPGVIVEKAVTVEKPQSAP